MVDRRRNGRKAVVLEVSYQRADGICADYLTDLGLGGLFVSTTKIFQIGQQIALDIKVPGAAEALQVQGVVRWQRPADESQGADIGVEFLFADDESAATTRQTLKKLLRRFGLR